MKVITMAYPGKITLDELQLQVRFQEQRNYELVDVHLFIDKNNTPRTACDYKELVLDLGESIKEIYIIRTGEDIPGSASLLFSDTVVVENSFILADFCR